ncbi:flagellar basal body L-ring protein FlgH [Sphingomonas sp. ID0503]|uniref:flagellar basal body L-ring protein FlgH n=1 Tax=Sphingomonas sp. ID0503 TaxID=3399691 RepID=UPI003AFB6087
MTVPSSPSETRFSRVLVGVAGVALCLYGAHPAEAKKPKLPDTQFQATYAPALPGPVYGAPPAAPTGANGAIFQAASGYAALIEGQRARRVGDTVTIVLVERTVASKSANSDLKRDGSFGLSVPTTGPLSLLKDTDAKFSGGSKWKGGGTADQSNALSGEVSVTVAEVYANGTMLVRGQKAVTLNRGDEFIQISGLIRPADIDPDNRIESTRVADAKIKYTGTGDVARSSRQGWLSRFFQVVSPF